MESEDFDVELALLTARSLQVVFARRTHRRKFMGQVYVVPGRLGEALRLPSIVERLQSKSTKRRQSGLADFQNLWATLSETTRQQALRDVGWYDPEELPWDDQRSNRRPWLPKDQRLPR